MPEHTEPATGWDRKRIHVGEHGRIRIQPLDERTVPVGEATVLLGRHSIETWEPHPAHRLPAAHTEPGRPKPLTVLELANALLGLAAADPDMPVRIVTDCAHEHHVSMYVRHVGEITPNSHTLGVGISDRPL